MFGVSTVVGNTTSENRDDIYTLRLTTRYTGTTSRAKFQSKKERAAVKMQMKQEVERNDWEVRKMNSSTKNNLFCRRMNVRVPLDQVVNVLWKRSALGWTTEKRHC